MADTAGLSTQKRLQDQAQDQAQNRAGTRVTVLEELRRLLPGVDDVHSTLPFGLPALDSHLPQGGLACGALHEIVPETEAAFAAAFGFMVALLDRITSPPPQSLRSGARKRDPGGGKQKQIILVLPAYGQREHGRLCGHGLNSLGLDPARITLAETAHRKETLWAVAEALHSGVPLAVAGMIDRLDLKTSRKLHLAAGDTGLPLLLLRPAQTLEASAAATRWRVGTAEAARDRFGLVAHPRWHLQLERCRNGRPGEWNVEYDHVTHRFSLAAALADHALSRGAGDHSLKPAPISAMG
jgi:protein ImuA